MLIMTAFIVMMTILQYKHLKSVKHVLQNFIMYIINLKLYISLIFQNYYTTQKQHRFLKRTGIISGTWNYRKIKALPCSGISCCYYEQGLSLPSTIYKSKPGQIMSAQRYHVLLLYHRYSDVHWGRCRRCDFPIHKRSISFVIDS